MNLKNDYIPSDFTKKEVDAILNSAILDPLSYISGGHAALTYGSITTTVSATPAAALGNYTIGSTAAPPSLKVPGTAEFDGDILIKGRNLVSVIENIEKRLAILVPDPAKLEKFEALRKAYDQYKMLEALCDMSEKKHGQ